MFNSCDGCVAFGVFRDHSASVPACKYHADVAEAVLACKLGRCDKFCTLEDVQRLLSKPEKSV